MHTCMQVRQPDTAIVHYVAISKLGKVNFTIYNYVLEELLENPCMGDNYMNRNEVYNL